MVRVGEWLNEGDGADKAPAPVEAASDALLDLENVGLRILFDPDAVSESAVVPLQWCYDPKLGERLAQLGIKDPQLLVSVTSDVNGREDRFMIDLLDGELMVSFRRSGPHTIRARIMWTHEYQSVKDMRHVVLSRHARSEYVYTFDQLAVQYSSHSIGYAKESIVISADFFAPTLSARERWWLTLWLGDMWDECAIRRRRLFAYSVQAVCVGAYVAVKCALRFVLAFFFSCILWQRRVNWEAVFRPFQYGWTDVIVPDCYLKNDPQDRAIGSFIRYDADGKPCDWSMHLLWLAFPPVHLFMVFLAWLSQNDGWDDFVHKLGQLYTLFGWIVVIVFAAVFAIIALRVIGGTLWTEVFGALDRWFGVRVRTARAFHALDDVLDRLLRGPVSDVFERVEHGRLERLARHYDAFTCERLPEGGGPRGVDALPVSPKRRLEVAFTHLKHRVCRPVSHG